MTPELEVYMIMTTFNLVVLIIASLVLYFTGAASTLMRIIESIFQEVSAKDNKTLVFSWRKGLTALVGINFVASNTGQVWFGAKEMTAACNSITAMVFAFYFGKDILNRLSIGKTPEVTSTEATGGA